MKLRTLALAVAGAALAPAAAFADGSGVVLTGVIHGSIDFLEAKNDDGTKPYKRQASIGNNATRWQIDGTEDLGWSKAIFSLAVDQPFAGCGNISGHCDNRVGLNDTTSDISNRNSYLGLTGGWGTFKIGQNEHQYEIQPILQDPDPASEVPFNALTMNTRYGLGNQGLNGGNNGLTRRDPGSIWYTSPDFGGVTIDVAYVTPNGRKFESSTVNISPQGFILAAQWKSPFGLSLYGGLAQYNDDAIGTTTGGVTTQVASDNKNRGLSFGVGYGMEIFQVDFRVEQLKFTASNGFATGIADPNFANLTEVKRNHVYLGGSVNLGQNHIRIAYTNAQKAKSNNGDVPDSGANNIMVQYAYTLSKRTELQAVIGKTDNKKNASYNTGVAGQDLSGISFGIRHTF
jgi:predicted porin